MTNRLFDQLSTKVRVQTLMRVFFSRLTCHERRSIYLSVSTRTLSALWLCFCLRSSRKPRGSFRKRVVFRVFPSWQWGANDARKTSLTQPALSGWPRPARTAVCPKTHFGALYAVTVRVCVSHLTRTSHIRTHTSLYDLDPSCTRRDSTPYKN